MNSIDKLTSEVSGRHPTRLAPVVMMMKDFEDSIKGKKRIAAEVLRDSIVIFGQERCYNLLSRVI